MTSSTSGSVARSRESGSSVETPIGAGGLAATDEPSRSTERYNQLSHRGVCSLRCWYLSLASTPG